MIARNLRRCICPVLALAALVWASGSAAAGLILTTNASTTAATAYNFGYVLVGQSGSVTINAKNTGTGALTAVTLPGVSGDFSNSGGPTPMVINSLAGGHSVSRNYGFAPGQRGTESQALTATANSGHTHLHTAMTLTGQGVAPVQSVTTAGAGYVRLGTVGQGSISITNTGDGNRSGLGAVSNLHGTAPAAAIGGPFTLGSPSSFSLTDHASQTFTYAFVPTAHGSVSGTAAVGFSNGSSDGKNGAQTVQVALSGQGVGPTFHSTLTPGSTLDFGKVEGHAKTLSFQIGNTSTDTNGGNRTLTDLSITKAVLTGPHTTGLSVSLNGYSSTKGLVLSEGASDTLSLTLQDRGPLGVRDGMLTLYTDQGAAFGGQGQTFTYQFHGLVAPEPGTMVLASLGIGGLCIGRWVRRKNKAGVPVI